MPFAREHIKVTGYDIDDIALYGGVKDFPIIKEKRNIHIFLISNLKSLN